VQEPVFAALLWMNKHKNITDSPVLTIFCFVANAFICNRRTNQFAKKKMCIMDRMAIPH